MILLRYFNSRPHEEVDREASDYVLTEYEFQLTTSRRGRHKTEGSTNVESEISTHDLTKRSTIASTHLSFTAGISTHDLTKRSTAKNSWISICLTFQLTTSRRGRHQSTWCCRYSTPISTHDLTKRSTLLRTIPTLYLMHFNSRPHEEVDYMISRTL